MLIAPAPNTEAAAWIKAKPLILASVFQEMKPELKARAFTITGIEHFDTLQAARELIAKVPEGEDWDDTKAQLETLISPWFTAKAAAKRAEYLLRTHVYQSYAVGNYRALEEARDLFPFRQYLSSEDPRVRPAHAALHRRIFPSDSPFWDTHTPPWEWGCRCDVVGLTEEEVDEIRDDEKHKPGDEKLVVEGALLDSVEQSNILHIGGGHTFNLSTGYAKQMDGGSGFYFEPGSLHLPLNVILARYDSTVADEFKSWAKTIVIDELKPLGHPDLWHWLENPKPWVSKNPKPPAWHPELNKPKPKPLKLPGDGGSIWTNITGAPKIKLPENKSGSIWTNIKGAPPPKPKKPRKPRAKKAPPAVAPILATAGPAGPALKDLKRVKKLGGSTGAELYVAPDGKQYVIKRGANPGHLREEFLADTIYRNLGIRVPMAWLEETPTGPVKIAEFIPGQTMAEWMQAASKAEKAAMAGKISEHFAADAVLGNWDVMGMGADNVLIDSAGNPWRIDNGGSLRYRAMGSLKNDDWNEYPTELWTMREPGGGAQGQAFAQFGGLNIYEVARQQLSPDAWKDAPAEVRDMLDARFQHFQDATTKALDMEHDRWTPGYADGLTKHLIGIRKAGISADLPKTLQQTPGSVQPKDENGLPFDHLRTGGGTAAASATSSDLYFPHIKAAAISIASHMKKGDFQYNPATIQVALDLKPKLQALGTSQAAHYLAALAEIEKGVANSIAKNAQMPAQVTEYKQAPTQAAAKKPGESLVTRLADYIKAQGGDLTVAADWKGGQAGSSWSGDAQAMKVFLAENMVLPDSDVYWRSDKKGSSVHLDAMRKRYGAKVVDVSLMIHHAFIQDLLGKTDMRFNDRKRRAIRLVRTESAAVASQMREVQKAGKGKKANLRVARGMCESSSLYSVTSVSGSTQHTTVQAVPHSLVTGVYLMERNAGHGGSSFLGDGENEFTFVAAAVPFFKTNKADMDGGANPQDAESWGTNLDHLRP
jgi:SPP1 gp7 family putative phage head morphogenesis protein